jgi:hypothetical protein
LKGGTSTKPHSLSLTLFDRHLSGTRPVNVLCLGTLALTVGSGARADASNRRPGSRQWPERPLVTSSITPFSTIYSSRSHRLHRLLMWIRISACHLDDHIEFPAVALVQPSLLPRNMSYVTPRHSNCQYEISVTRSNAKSTHAAVFWPCMSSPHAVPGTTVG